MQWVDSVFHTLTIQEKIGQLFIVPLSSYTTATNPENLTSYIKKCVPGGIFITQGECGTARWINQLQQASKIPLLMGIDAEWGLAQTLDGIIPFHNTMMTGSIKDASLLRAVGMEVARQMKIMGIQVSFSLDVDAKASMYNPLGGIRTAMSMAPALAFMEGLQRMGILACTKNTPLISRGKKHPHPAHTQMTKVSPLRMYNKLSDSNVDGLLLPSLRTPLANKKESNISAASLSFTIKKLRTKVGFAGLVFTPVHYPDSAEKPPPGEIEKAAIIAGSNMLISSYDIEGAIQNIALAARKSMVLKRQLDKSVRKILSVKYNQGLARLPKTNTDAVCSRINSKKAHLLKMKLAEATITIAKNETGQIPIQTLSNCTFAVLSIGSGQYSTFEKYLSKFAPFTKYAVKDIQDTLALAQHLDDFDVVVMGVYAMDSSLRDTIIPWINKLDIKQKIILCSFSNPHDLAQLEKMPSTVIGYTDKDAIPMLAAQIIFGVYQGRGILPVTFNPWLRQGQGKPNIQVHRLGYNNLPESAGMDSNTLNEIKQIVQTAIDSSATPGCSIIVARKGKVVFEEAFGWKTYDKKEPIIKETIYDLASITKVAATLQAVMALHDRKLIDIEKKASVYLPELRHSNKQDITIKDLLTHQAGLWPFLPFWKNTISDSTPWKRYYSDIQSKEYPFPMTKNMFAFHTIQDSLWQWIIQSRVRKKENRLPYNYKYSDMGFYIMHRLAEKLFHQPMEEFLTQNLYKPLGAYTIGYLPLNRFPVAQIAPTEVDKEFRKSILVGFVHDQGAAMRGGVAGHAGLFSNANDLAKLGQLWLQKGYYGGIQYIDSTTIAKFTTQQYASNRRGLGWDKPAIGNWNGPTSPYASAKTFGHTGFTGTAIWVDPEFDLVYVFLSNRIYPDANNTKLITLNIRTRIQDAIYRSIFNYCKYQN